MLTRKSIQKVKKVRSYEQYLNDYKKWKEDKEYLHLQELYSQSTDETERTALARAMYQMEVE